LKSVLGMMMKEPKNTKRNLKKRSDILKILKHTAIRKRALWLFFVSFKKNMNNCNSFFIKYSWNFIL